MTMATIPALLLPSDTVPARTAMHAHWPAAAKSMSFLRPSRSMIQIGINDEKKYAIPLKPASRSERLCDIPTDFWKMTGAYWQTMSDQGIRQCKKRGAHVGDEIDPRKLLHKLSTNT